MKTKFEVQYNDHNVVTSDVEKIVKEDLKQKGVKVSTIDTLEIYYAPDNTSVYYVATLKTGEVVNNEEALYI